MNTFAAEQNIGIFPRRTSLPLPLPTARPFAPRAGTAVLDTFEAVKRMSRWHAAPQPNFKPWSARISLTGVVLAAPAMAALLIRSVSSPVHFISFALAAFGLFAMLVASAVYHACLGPESRVKLLRRFDYAAISVMIGGSFAPFCLIGLPTVLGLGVLTGVWVLGAYAVYLIATHEELPIWGLIALYITMGWMGLLVIVPVSVAIGWKGAALVFAGGIVYTVGTIFFNGDENKYKPRRFGRHEIWHILILVAAALHYSVLALYMRP